MLSETDDRDIGQPHTEHARPGASTERTTLFTGEPKNRDEKQKMAGFLDGWYKAGLMAPTSNCPHMTVPLLLLCGASCHDLETDDSVMIKNTPADKRTIPKALPRVE